LTVTLVRIYTQAQGEMLSFQIKCEL
jgi:hypothetical protein